MMSSVQLIKLTDRRGRADMLEPFRIQRKRGYVDYHNWLSVISNKTAGKAHRANFPKISGKQKLFFEKNIPVTSLPW